MKYWFGSGWEDLVLQLWDLADQCCSPREVLSLEIEDYGVWHWVMVGSFWDIVHFEAAYW